MIEAAIVTPLLMLLVFGIIEFGMLFKDASSVSASSASGARTASTQSRQAGYQTSAALAVAATLNSVKAHPELLVVYRADPQTGRVWGGTEPQDCTSGTMCYRFTWNASNGSWTQATTPTWAASTQTACGTVAENEYVGVYVLAKHDMLTGMFGSSRRISERTIMRLEPVPLPCKP